MVQDEPGEAALRDLVGLGSVLAGRERGAPAAPAGIAWDMCTRLLLGRICVRTWEVVVRSTPARLRSRRVLACAQGEEPLIPAGLWYDCAILRKLMYKNKSQHRRTKYYQHLQAVERDVRLLRLTCCDELAAAMAQSVQQGLVKATLPVVSMHRTLGYECMFVYCV